MVVGLGWGLVTHTSPAQQSAEQHRQEVRLVSGREETGLGQPGEPSWKRLPALVQTSGVRGLWMTAESTV